MTKELMTSVAFAPGVFGFCKDVILDPGKEADAAAAILMKKIELMSSKEKSIYDKYAGKVYIELIINDNYYSFVQEVN